MRHLTPEPVAASDLAGLGAALTPAAKLGGYDALLEAALERFRDPPPTACIGTARTVGGRSVPCLIVVSDDEIGECWLTGNTVRTVTTARPDIGP